MVQRYVITLCILAGALIPLYSYAQAKNAAPQADKNAAKVEEQVHKNRLDRAGNAINAAEANVLSLEKHIQKLAGRIELLEKAGADLKTVKGHMSTALQHIATAKQSVAAMKESLTSLDTKNQEQIAILRTHIKNTQTEVHAAKDATKDVFVAIRALTLKRQTPVITPATSSQPQ